MFDCFQGGMTRFPLDPPLPPIAPSLTQGQTQERHLEGGGQLGKNRKNIVFLKKISQNFNIWGHGPLLPP